MEPIPVCIFIASFVQRQCRGKGITLMFGIDNNATDNEQTVFLKQTKKKKRS